MKSSRAVPLTLLASVAASLTGCGHSSPPPVMPAQSIGAGLGGAALSTPCLDSANRMVDNRFCQGGSGMPGGGAGYHYSQRVRPLEGTGSHSSTVTATPAGTARGVVGAAGEAATAGAHAGGASGGGE